MSRMARSLIVLPLILCACSSREAAPEAPRETEIPAISVTLWSARTELFMEHPPLVKGEPASFAVHLTSLATFKPLTEGKATLELRGTRESVRFQSPAPSRPGVFRIDVTPAEAGTSRAALLVEGGGLTDSHDLGAIVVYESLEAALRGMTAPDEGETISYLKEQQWNAEFATEVIGPRRMTRTLRVPATAQPRGGGEGHVVAPVAGRLLPTVNLPLSGERVEQGQVVAAVLPFTSGAQDPAGLRLELAQAQTDLEQARRQRARLDQLLAVQAIPARRVEEARAEESRAQARLEAARARIAQYEHSRTADAAPDGDTAFRAKAPLAGIVTSLSVAPGSIVEAGQVILSIVSPDRLWIVAEVPESDAGALGMLRTAELEIPGLSPGAPAITGTVRIRNIGRTVNPESRRIPVTLEVVNQNGLLRIGQSLFVRFGVGDPVETLAAPISSLVDDGGQTVVFVQSAGESFAKRIVRSGMSGEGYVQILSGLQPGERVVSQGGYAVRLAALSTQIPAHGHVH